MTDKVCDTRAHKPFAVCSWHFSLTFGKAENSVPMEPASAAVAPKDVSGNTEADTEGSSRRCSNVIIS